MMHADSAKVAWNSNKKRWEVQILVGAEVIKRSMPKNLSGEAALKTQAVATARDEGYEVSPEQIALVQA
jgi:hypothetical protein